MCAPELSTGCGSVCSRRASATHTALHPKQPSHKQASNSLFSAMAVQNMTNRAAGEVIISIVTVQPASKCLHECLSQIKRKDRLLGFAIPGSTED